MFMALTLAATLVSPIYPTPKMSCPEGFGEEGYRITIQNFKDETGTTHKINTEFNTQAGHFYASKTLKKLNEMYNGNLPEMVLEDTPDIPYRGVVEGFYGRPWGHAARLKLMNYMGDLKMNTYIYGPKDDPYHHARWKQAYPKTMQREFKELLDAADRNFVKCYWAIHLAEAQDVDFPEIIAKLESMYNIGFRSFAVFFDDYGSNGPKHHAKICNYILNEFLKKKGNCNKLIVCPNVYWGNGNNVYCKTLGAELDPSIEIMWTGRTICTDIDAKISAEVEANYQRSPFVWWNWPVNDFRRSKLLMGPTYGVEPYKFGGFVTNPMENFEASKIGIFGVADFAWNMKAFDSRKNWLAAIDYLFPYAKCAMKRFCDHNADPNEIGSAPKWGWTRKESELFLESGKSLEDECRDMIATSRELEVVLPDEDPDLWREVKNWVAMMETVGEEGLAAIHGDIPAYEAARARKKEIGLEQAEYFKSMTFQHDKRNCQPCYVATTVIQPEIDALAKDMLRSRADLYFRYFPVIGETVGNIANLKGASLHGERQNRLVVMDDVREQITAKPGEWFGIKIPDDSAISWVWANFDTDEVSKGKIFLSTDGEHWVDSKEKTNGNGLYSFKVDKAWKYHYAVWVNTSKTETITFKIKRYNVDL